MTTIITEATTCRCGHYGGSNGTERNLHAHCPTCWNTTRADGVCRRADADGVCPDQKFEDRKRRAKERREIKAAVALGGLDAVAEARYSISEDRFNGKPCGVVNCPVCAP
jgi:hypothetical protein